MFFFLHEKYEKLLVLRGIGKKVHRCPTDVTPAKCLDQITGPINKPVTTHTEWQTEILLVRPLLFCSFF